MRAASHSSHVQINRHPLLLGLTSPDYSILSYRAVLIAYFHLFEKLETSIDNFVLNEQVSFDYSSRSKLPWIKEDLNFFGEDPYLETNLPTKAIEFPDITTVGQLIGVLYAIEGGTLGGQVISKNLHKNHNLLMHQGARFFNGYAESTRIRWDEFCRFADSIQNNIEQCKWAETFAVLTFNKFEEGLDDYYQSRF
jgi:heme oxygenase